MRYCIKCGHPLTLKKLDLDGDIPYCEHCHEFRFEPFNSAISTVMLNPDMTKILMIQQYNRHNNILVAGYIMKGENAKEALVREVKEEVGLNVTKFLYNDNEYFRTTNTLIHNYITVLDAEDWRLTNEVDRATWFPIATALDHIKPCSLAKHFLTLALKKLEQYDLDDFVDVAAISNIERTW